MTATIPHRVNLYLWLLTGRSSNFNNPVLNISTPLHVGAVDPVIQELRALLRLHDTNSDVAPLSVMAAIYSSKSMLRDLPPETSAIFTRGVLKLSPVTSSLPMLPSDGVSWPSVSGEVAGRDGFTVVAFAGLSTTSALITTDAGGSVETEVRQLALPGGHYRVVFTEAGRFGIRAHFDSPALFDNGDTVTVTVSPTHYPWRTIVDKINQTTAALRLMNDEGTLQAFMSTSSAAEKVGFLGLAILRCMLKVVNVEQIGVEITTAKVSGSEGIPEQQQTLETRWLTASPLPACNAEQFNV